MPIYIGNNNLVGILYVLIVRLFLLFIQAGGSERDFLRLIIIRVVVSSSYGFFYYNEDLVLPAVLYNILAAVAYKAPLHRQFRAKRAVFVLFDWYNMCCALKITKY